MLSPISNKTQFHGATLNESSPTSIAEFFNLPRDIDIPKKIDAGRTRFMAFYSYFHFLSYSLEKRAADLYLLSKLILEDRRVQCG